ncbi:MAG: hypothetical protein methR_P1272 [Methyloprofundus sp.]|nr:MAG: hypothetical protein methR_P1272 [Methyloprofundus sp.]
MSQQRNNHLILKILVIGGLIAILVYLFHPGVGALNLTINGEPVTDPLMRLAKIPTLLFTLLFIGVLMIITFLGVSTAIFMAALVFVMMGILFVAPYFTPMLVIIFLMVLFMSIGDTKKN